MKGEQKIMEDIFISDFLELNDELDQLGVFDAVITTDSHFFINILRLKETSVPQFSTSYQKINEYFRNIMILLTASKEKGDRFYKQALRSFDFSGVNGINLGFSETGVDAGFGKRLAKNVISDAFDIVKTGSTQPEIFQLVGLFEENVAADRLSDMIATLIADDIREYTLWVNQELNINKDNYPELTFNDGIVINPYKGCDLLYLPIDILHELPIARDWTDLDRVISENNAIKEEINQAIGKEWSKMLAGQKKDYLLNQIFKVPAKCENVIDYYRKETVDKYDPLKDFNYLSSWSFKLMKDSGVLDFLEHSDTTQKSSWEVTLKVLEIFKDFIENNKGWEILYLVPTNKGEKVAQKLIQNGGTYCCEEHNVDMTFEANEGPGPVDMKISRGMDKTIVEVKLSSNGEYLHGFTDQIEEYARAEKCTQRIYLYIKVGNHPGRDKTIQDKYDEEFSKGNNPPLLFVVDATQRTSASKSS